MTIFRKVAASVAATGTAGAVGAGVIVYRYAESLEFRRWLRSELAIAARSAEDVLEAVHPNAIKAIRIDEEALEGDASDMKEAAGQLASLKEGSSSCAQPNVGRAPLPPLEPLSGNVGFFFRKFAAKPKAPPLEPEAVESTTSDPDADGMSDALSDSIEDVPVPMTPTAPLTPLTPMAAAAPSQGLSAGSADVASAVATLADLSDVPAEEDAEMPVETLEAEETETLLPDGAAWLRPSAVSSATGTWASAAPAEPATCMQVPAAAAARFEAAMEAYARAEAEAEGAAGADGGGGGGGDGLGDGDGGGGLRCRRSGDDGWETIELPDKFRDGAFPEDGASALLLQWLRVSEAYVRAEASALSEIRAGLSRRALGCEGGGLALMRAEARLRQVAWQLKSIEADKEAVKARA